MSRMRILCPQYAAGSFRNFGNDLSGKRIDLAISHRLFARLNGYRDRNRLLTGLDAPAFVDVKYSDIGDKLLVDALRGTNDVGGLTAVSTTKAKSRSTGWKGDSSSSGLA